MEQENDLHYHALNYRTAATPDAEQEWHEFTILRGAVGGSGTRGV